MRNLDMNLTVNGRKVSKPAKPHLRLIDFLRDDLGLTGTKEGCGAGECGTCSVFLNGKLVKSCLVPVAKAIGSEIETVESLAATGQLSALQKGFHETGASQCGYCIPGMVMAATATLRDNPNAGLEEIKERLGGNICRCTGYAKIFEAVEIARDALSGKLELPEDDRFAATGSFIGASVRRMDAPSKVSGRIKYAGDMVVPGMLHMQVLRSPHAHARIKSIDTSAAEEMAGVACVITAGDVPGKDGFGVFVHDQPVMARGVVRYVGEAVAAVAAEDVETAKSALNRIEVSYEPLPAVFDPSDAMQPGAPVIHEYSSDNVVKRIPVRKGETKRAFPEADLIIEETFRTQPVEHAYLEPEAGIAYVDHDDVVTVISPSQNITHHRHMLAKIIDKPINKVRFIMSPVGGGFGGKEDMIYQGMLALAAMKSGRPVRLVFTREESIISTAKRHPATIHYRMALDSTGRIAAAEFDMLSDGGAYGMSTEGVMRKAAILSCGPYDIPNVEIDTIGVYTNNTPSGAFRTFGAMQAQFATECMLDIAAGELGIDPFEIRRRNMMREGGRTHTKQKLGPVSLDRVLDAAEEKSQWEAGPPTVRGPARQDLGTDGNRLPCTLGARIRQGDPVKRRGDDGKARGRGMAASWYGIARTATIDRAGAWVELDDGGTAKVVTGVTEIGEGILTLLAQVAADELGIRPRDVTIGDNDTARSPEAAHAGATRQTYMIGNSVALACREARARLDAEIASHWNVPADSIEAFNGEIWARGTNFKATMEEAVDIAKKRGIVPVGSGTFTARGTGLDPVDGSGSPWQAYVYGCQVAEVEVDTVTGEVQVLGIWAAHDVGRAINPRGVEGQIEGGIVQGLGQALMEHYKQAEGRTSTPGFAKYILPTSLDVPKINSTIIEDRDPLSPLGAKGIGEPSLVPTAPAIINAIYDAVGVRITSLPATPEKVLEAMAELSSSNDETRLAMAAE
ncbi:MAG: molybdopterin-dependent oxidoreductase [Albidovulum sp.]|nr:molybdopterin-dependent oxidoreductase [Albidovulum sp.]